MQICGIRVKNQSFATLLTFNLSKQIYKLQV